MELWWQISNSRKPNTHIIKKETAYKELISQIIVKVRNSRTELRKYDLKDYSF